MKVTWTTRLTGGEISLDLVARETCASMSRQAVDVTLIDAAAPGVLAAEDGADVCVRCVWPPETTPPRDGRWVWYQPWGFGGLPRGWVPLMRSTVDEVWVPTSHDRTLFARRGVPEERIAVVPHGIDPAMFRPDAPALELPTERPFRFLYVGGGTWRKAPDAVLAAFTSAFSTDDPVALVVKDYGGPATTKLRDAVAAAVSKPGCPEITYISSVLSYDTMPSLYAACDVLVHPYRIEAFSLPIVEAMACGLVVLVPNHGACLDYSDSSKAVLLSGEVRSSSDIKIGDLDLDGDVEWFEVDRDDLASQMRRVHTEWPAASAMGQAAAAHVRQAVTWDVAAAAASARASALAPPRALGHPSAVSRAASRPMPSDLEVLL